MQYNIRELTQKDLYWLDWKKEDIEALPEKYKQECQEKIQTAKNTPKEERTVKNSVVVFNNFLGEPIHDWANIIDFIFCTHQSKEIREAAELSKIEIEKISNELENDPELNDILYELDEDKLSPFDLKYLNDVKLHYKLKGFNLGKDKQNTLLANKHKINTLCRDFYKNILKFKGQILVSKEDLDGLSNEYISLLKKEGDKYIITTDKPISSPFMLYSKNREKRRELYNILRKKGTKENLKLLEEIISLRNQNAKLLGYSNHCEQMLKVRMAKSIENVNNLYNSFHDTLKEKSIQDIELIKSYAKKDGIDDLENYDTSYYARLARQDKTGIDSESLRPYFRQENVLNEMMRLFSELFSLTIKRIDNIKLWHDYASIYSVKDTETNTLIGYIGFDLFPREGKYKHAAAFGIQNVKQDKDSFAPPIKVTVANFRPKTNNTPSLLSFGEITTLFHEFGHCLHGILGQFDNNYLNSFNTSLDFVEVPSQLLENWAWNRDVIKNMSSHYKTGEPLPDEQIKKLIESKLFQNGLTLHGQSILSALDIAIHTGKIDKDFHIFYQDKLKDDLRLKPDYESLFPASFGHLSSQYSAGYYSYMWSLVYADDIYSVFKENGILNKDLGLKLRQEIFASGFSRDELTSIKSFLGREPNSKAFLEQEGITNQ